MLQQIELKLQIATLSFGIISHILQPTTPTIFMSLS